MNYTSDTIASVITSEAALRALDYISPVYSEAETFLKVLNAVCSELDGIVEFAEGVSAEMIPNETTWALPYWEKEYGITPGISAVADRKAKVMKRITEKSPANPARLRALAEQLSGGSARIVVDVAEKKITVYLSAAYSASVKKIVEDEISRRKPAHLSLEVEFEQSTSASVALIGYFAYGRKFSMGQVN